MTGRYAVARMLERQSATLDTRTELGFLSHQDGSGKEHWLITVSY
jgi:hypothetical protein